jgi:thioredoxin reductase
LRHWQHCMRLAPGVVTLAHVATGGDEDVSDVREPNEVRPMGDGGDGYDVVVVGGGPAGLSGALTLARARRSVLVVDAGEPRNAPAAGVHGFLTRDGTSPQELLALGREEARRYGAEIADARVDAVETLAGAEAAEAAEAADAGDHRFVVSLSSGRRVRARRLLVTTGLVDELPDVPGVRELWGRDVVHCPYCHGWEIADRPLGVLATGPMAVHQALLLRQWSPDVVLFQHTNPPATDDELARLAARGIRVVEGKVEALEIAGDHGDRLRGVRLETGEVVPREALAVQPRFLARGQVLATLGLDATEDPLGISTRVPSDHTGRTDVPGVWVAGNVADPFAHVVGAAASGVTAAAAVNADLLGLGH